MEKEIEILGYTWTFELKDDWIDDDELYGCTYFGKNKIIVNNKLLELDKLTTIIHELKHAIQKESGLTDKFFKGEGEEELYNKVSSGPLAKAFLTIFDIKLKEAKDGTK